MLSSVDRDQIDFLGLLTCVGFQEEFGGESCTHGGEQREPHDFEYESKHSPTLRLRCAGKISAVPTVSVFMNGPNPLKVAWNIFLVINTTKRPNPTGIGSVDHSQFSDLLEMLADGGLEALADRDSDLSAYIAKMNTIDPDTLSRHEALAFWLNLYNAGAMRLAVQAHRSGSESVLRVPGGFNRPIVEVAGEELSLDAIEHGKLRKFGDPRIHGALICGSVSCPTLRRTPYTGHGLDTELTEQMSYFVSQGGAVADGDDALKLSRVFLWFGADFVRPQRMPTFLPASKKALLSALEEWLPDDLSGRTRVSFQSYHWGLRCSVA